MSAPSIYLLSERVFTAWFVWLCNVACLQFSQPMAGRHPRIPGPLTSASLHALGPYTLFYIGLLERAHFCTHLCRGGEATMDISADLAELGRCPLAVVCAGVKSILDIGRTLEVLETQGVAVAAYRSDEFPAFFTAASGHRAPCRVDNPEHAAGMVAALGRLGLGSGMVLAVPIPQQHAVEGRRIQAAIDQALTEADSKRVKGNEVTPFLLDRVQQLTGGASLTANIALVKNNAAVGTQVAVALAALQRGERR